MSVRSVCLPLVFTIISFCLNACSSSNSGPTRPDTIKDDKAPTIVQSFPTNEDVFLSTQTTIVFRFDERLDTSDNRVDKGVSLNVVDVFVGDADESENGSSDAGELALRERPFSYREEIFITNTEATEEIDGLSKEVEATSLSIRASQASANFRFSLNTQYRILLGPPLRDLSSIESIDPITAEKTTGNFLEEFDYEFVTRDGVWNSPMTLLSTLNIIGAPKFISSSTNSFAIFKAERTIPDSTTTLIGLYALRYDNVREEWDDDAVVIDDYPIRDNPDYDPNLDVVNEYYDADRDDVSEFDVSVVDNKITVAFLQKSNVGSSPSVFVRVFDEEWNARLQVEDNQQNENLERVQLAPADIGLYITWLNEGGSASEKQVNLDMLLFSEQQETGLISFVNTLNGDFNLPSELTSASNNTRSVKVAKLTNSNPLLISHTEISAQERLLSFKAEVDLLSFKENLERFKTDFQNCESEDTEAKKNECTQALTEPEFFWSVEELTTPGTPTEADFSLSINESSEGFIAWKQMDSSVFNLYTRRFDGNRWSSAELMEFDDRGNARFVEIQTTNDGHAILVWSSDNGDGSSSLKARSYVFEENEIARNFAGERILNASLGSDISSGSLTADHEGNANLSLLLGDERLLNYRYRDNNAVSQAWEELSPIDSSFPMFASSSQNIAKDGRMALLWTELINGIFTLKSSLFKEDRGG